MSVPLLEIILMFNLSELSFPSFTESMEYMESFVPALTKLASTGDDPEFDLLIGEYNHARDDLYALCSKLVPVPTSAHKL